MGSLTQVREQAERETGRGGTFKAKEGANKIRVLALPVPYVKSVTDKKGVKKNQLKYVTFVSHEGVVKLYFMPSIIFKNLETLQDSDEYAFDSFPMPYDLTLNAVGAGTMEVKYTLLAARKESPVAEEILAQLADKEDVNAIVQRLRDRDALEVLPEPPITVEPIEEDEEPLEEGERSITETDQAMLDVLHNGLEKVAGNLGAG